MGWGDKLRKMDAGLQRSKGGLILPASAPPETQVFDQIGRAITHGDFVLVIGQSVMATVQSVTPVVHPGMPPGAVKVRLHADLELLSPNGAPLEGLFRLFTAKEVAATRGKVDQREGAPGVEGGEEPPVTPSAGPEGQYQGQPTPDPGVILE